MGLYDSFAAYYHTWGGHFRGKYDKLFAYGIIALLFFFSILDTCVVWGNYYDLTDPGFQFALVTGHAGDVALVALYVLGVLSAIACVVECLNILSMMLNGGHAKIPVELEQVVVLLCEGIPVGAVNLSIVMCRQDVATAYQMVCGLVSVFKSGLRMYFYGWFKERHFKYERSMYKWTVKIAIYISASVPWVMLFFTQCFTWHHADIGGIYSPKTELSRYQSLSGISIILVNKHDFDHDKSTRHIGSYFSHDIQYCHDTNRIYFVNDVNEEYWERPVLVKNISDIADAGDLLYNVSVGCQGNDFGNNTFRLPECNGNNTYHFSFLYRYKRSHRDSQPFGEITVAMAMSDDYDYQTCHHLNQTLSHGWELHFFRINSMINNSTDPDDISNHGNSYYRNSSCERAKLEQPWGKVCFPPVPRFMPNLDICDD